MEGHVTMAAALEEFILKSVGAFYFIFYLASSAFLPYFSIFLSDRGIGSANIGFVLSLFSFVGVISQPVMGMMNDRLRDRRGLLFLCAVVSPIVALGYLFGNSYAAIIVITIVFSWFQSSSMPLADALAIEVASRERFTFGSVRLWGALSFSLGTLVTGFAFSKYGYDKSILVYGALHVFVIGSLFFFPRIKPSAHRISWISQTKQVFLHKRFMALAGISFLLTFATAVNFYFLPIYFKSMDFDRGWIGTAYTIAALIEVPMFWYSTKLNVLLGRKYVLAIAAMLYAAKCLVLAMSHHVVPVLAVQLFDGISYAFFASAALETVDTFSDKFTKATFQTVFAAITSGLGGIIGTAAGGVIVERLGPAVLYYILFALCLVSAMGYVLAGKVFMNNDRETVSNLVD